MRGRSYFLLSFSAISIGCSAFSDISNTLKEVKQSNANMETLIALSKDAKTEIQKTNLTASNTLLKLIESVDEVKKSNANMDSLIRLATETLDAVHDKDQKLEKLLELSQDTFKELVRSRIASESILTEVSKTRKATEATLEKLDQQEVAVLNETLTNLVAVVRDVNQENYYRVASAIAVYKLLLEHNLPPEWYSKFVASNIEMCERKVKNSGVGEVCNGFFMTGKLGKGETRRSNSLATKVVMQVLKRLPPDWLKNFQVEPFRPNLVWALALNPPFLKKFFAYVIANLKSPLAAISEEFIFVASRMLVTSLQGMAEQEWKKKPLQLSQLVDFQRRRLNVLFMHELLGTPLDGMALELRQATFTLIAALKDRKLTPEESEVLKELESTSSSPEKA